MIGVYDSGVGGLSVWKELVSLMPEKGYIYVADTAHCPYGEKPIDYIIERADMVSSFLISQGAKMVVVACNTATAAAINFLRNKYPIPFVGMEPAVKPAAIISKSGVVGVLATANTFKGRLYRDTVMKYCSKTKVIEVVGKGLVEAVESGSSAELLLRKYISDLTAQKADVLVLGCTHFPFLTEQIRMIAPDDMTIINPAPAVALQAQKIANTLNICNNKRRVFYSTGRTESLERIAKTIDNTLTADSFIHTDI